MAKRKFDLTAGLPAPPQAAPVPGPVASAADVPYAEYGPLHELPKPLAPADLDQRTTDELKSIGWDGKSYVPGDLAQKLAAVRTKYDTERQLAATDAAALAASRPAKIKQVSLASLPEAAKREFMQQLAEGEIIRKRVAAEGAVNPVWEYKPGQPVPPGINLHSPSVPAEPSAGPQVSPPPPPAAPASLPTGPVEVVADDNLLIPIQQLTAAQGLQATVPPSEASPTAAPAGVLPLSDGGKAGAFPLPAVCPRCSWNVAVPFETQVTDVDKVNFEMTFHGKRFFREFRVLNDRVRVRFRSLTLRENRMVEIQIAHDVREADKQGEPLTQLTLINRILDYQLSLSLAGITALSPTGAPAAAVDEEIPESTEIQFQPRPGHPTMLPSWLETFLDAYVPTEQMMSLLRQTQTEFRKLLGKLEAMRAEPNFWPGIV